MMRKKIGLLTTAVVMVLSAAVAIGANATFTPLGATTVTPGTEIRFTVFVSVESLGGFDAADIAIGSNDATDIGFEYSASWEAALQNVTPPTPDVQLYAQDVFVGGNNPAPVGSGLMLGTVTVDTTGMGEGVYEVRIDPAIGPDVSSLVLEGNHEGLQGSALFAIQCAVFDPQCDNDVDLDDYTSFRPCLSGPGQEIMGSCGRFDATGDGHVDLADMSVFLTEFTGSF